MRNNESSDLHHFLTLLAVCHTVVVDSHLDPLEYQASSPDELALTHGASQLSFTLLKRDGKTITIKKANTSRVFQVHAEFAFDSDRKRMTLVVESLKDHRYYLMCKGADSIMIPRC